MKSELASLSIKAAKTLAAVSLLLALMLSLSSCSSAPAESATDSDSDFQNTYSYSETSLPAPMTLSTSQYSDGQNIYYCGMDISGAPLLIRTGTDETTGLPSTTEYALPEKTAFIHSCCKADRRLVVIAGDTRPLNSLSGNGELIINEQDSYNLYLLAFTESGNIISSTLLDDAPFTNGISIRSIVYLDGYFYMLSQSLLIQTDSSGHVLNTLSLDSGTFTAQAVVNGELLVCCYTGDGENPASLARLISPETLDFDFFYTIDSWQVTGIGSTAQGALLVNDGGQIYTLDTTTGNTELFFDFYKADVGISDYANIYPYNNGYLLSAHYQNSSVTLSLGISDSRTELTLWTEHMVSEVLDYVRGFNQESKDYYITALDISGLTQAQIMGKISAGDAPDLYHVCDSSVFFNMNQEQIFEDLNPLMAGSILPDLQRCLEKDGKLYLLPTDFYFGTVVTYKHSPVDTDLTLARQEQEAQASNYALFTYYQDPATIWYYLSRMYMYSNVDVESASCDFETPLFTQLLEYCSDPNSNEGGTNLDFRRSVYNFDVFPGPLRLVYFQQEYGDELQLTSPFGSEFYLGQCFAMSNTSPHKEGATEFLAYANRREPDNVRFTWPASAELFRQLIDEYVNTGVWYDNENRFVTFTDNTVEQLYALLANTKGIDQSYPELLDIIDEEAQKCFAGDATAQSAAAQIQSRAGIYLSEQYG